MTYTYIHYYDIHLQNMLKIRIIKYHFKELPFLIHFIYTYILQIYCIRNENIHKYVSILHNVIKICWNP